MTSPFHDHENPLKPEAGPAASLPGLDPEAFLAAIVESSEDAIVSKSLSGIITTWNKAAERLFGYSSDEAVGRPVTIIIPEDRLEEEPAILARIHAGQRVEHFETVRRRKDGGLVDLSLTISPIRERTGSIIGASKIARDISERKRAAEHRELLLREMHHRIKNLFAITGSIVSLSARTAQTPADLASGVRDRLSALSRAHQLTLPAFAGDDGFEKTSITLFQLLSNVLAPYEIEGARQFRLKGEDLEISAGQLTNLALLIHEFATNAAKYGSLSIAEGRLDVAVSLRDDMLDLRWVESNGPRLPVGGGREAGFGNRLEQSVAASLRADITRDWRPHGLSIRVVVPLGILTTD